MVALMLAALGAALLAPLVAQAELAGVGGPPCQMGGTGYELQPDLAHCVATVNVSCTMPTACFAGCAAYLNGWKQQPVCVIAYDDPQGHSRFIGLSTSVEQTVQTKPAENVDACRNWCLDVYVGVDTNELITMCNLGCSEAKAAIAERIEREEYAAAEAEALAAMIAGIVAGVLAVSVLSYLYLKPKCQLHFVKATVEKQFDDLREAEEKKAKAMAEKAERKAARKKKRADKATKAQQEANRRITDKQIALEEERERTARNDQKMADRIAEQKAEGQRHAEADRKAAEAEAAEAAARAKVIQDDATATAAKKQAAEEAAVEAAEAAKAAKTADRIANAKAHQDKHSGAMVMLPELRGSRQGSASPKTSSW